MLAKEMAVQRKAVNVSGQGVSTSAIPLGSQIGSMQFHSLLKGQSSVSAGDISSQIVNFIKYSLCRTANTIDVFGMYQATSMSIRNRLIDNWQKTTETQVQTKARSVAYLSLEFLMGRALTNTLYNLEVGATYHESLKELGFKLEDIQAEEQDAALGNGGLGRLAACFIDSMASLDIPAYGYGIKYNYGMFKQRIVDGYQFEEPENWLRHGNPFPLVERLDREYIINFRGYTDIKKMPDGKEKYRWVGGEQVKAVAYDCLCPGNHTQNVANIRLWSARPHSEFKLDSHMSGNFYDAIKEKAESENISYVLYPNDNTDEGKKLRLKQEFFFVSASLQDILVRAKEMGVSASELDKYFAVQLNDTHPTLGVPELMRLLMDECDYDWDHSWAIVSKVFHYTNHTVLPEALEKWPVQVVKELLPRHADIIFEINRRWMLELKAKNVSDDNIRKLSIIDNSGCTYVRMANLAIVGSCKVNGVAALHSKIIVDDLFKEFYALDPNKFTNVTNGVTPRRWIAQCNPLLSHFITKNLKHGGHVASELDWVTDMSKLKKLIELENDAQQM